MGEMPADATLIAVAVVRRASEVLIGRRPEGVPLAGYWEFPGGKVRAGESPREAAARECLEETGITVEVGEEYPAATHHYPHGRVELRFFACTPREPPAEPRPPFRWAPVASLGEYRFPPANAALLEFLLADSAVAGSSGRPTANQPTTENAETAEG